MNEKELEKMRKRFFKHWIEWRDGVNQDSMRISEQVRPFGLWELTEKELKEAYHKGYMAGTMEALWQHKRASSGEDLT